MDNSSFVQKHVFIGCKNCSLSLATMEQSWGKWRPQRPSSYATTLCAPWPKLFGLVACTGIHNKLAINWVVMGTTFISLLERSISWEKKLRTLLLLLLLLITNWYGRHARQSRCCPYKQVIVMIKNRMIGYPESTRCCGAPFRIVSFTKEAIHSISQSAAAFQRNIWTVGRQNKHWS